MRRRNGTAANPVRAAGGVVWRPAGPGGIEVCLVHRPRYDDWSLPKGKLDPGEHPLLAAVREVAEEADVRAVPQVRLPSVRYAVHGEPKVVDYWSMRADGTGGFQPDTEVDGVRWLPVDEAARLVSYPHDARVLRDFAALPPVTAVLGLVRHASAGRRGTWSGPDDARPLDPAGRAMAEALARLLAPLHPVRLRSAASRRCVQTLHPLADLLDLPIEVDTAFDEPRAGRDPDEHALAAAARLAELADAGTNAAVCGQGTVISGALARLAAAGRPVGDPVGRAAGHATALGDGWLLAFSGDRLVAADRLAGGVGAAMPGLGDTDRD